MKDALETAAEAVAADAQTAMWAAGDAVDAAVKAERRALDAETQTIEASYAMQRAWTELFTLTSKGNQIAQQAGEVVRKEVIKLNAASFAASEAALEATRKLQQTISIEDDAYEALNAAHWSLGKLQ